MKRLFFTALALGLSGVVRAQAYNFTHFFSNYSNLVGSTSLNNGATWDDPDYVVPLGFTFNLFTTPINEIYVDGNLGLGGYLSSGICGAIDTVSLFVPYGPDIADRGFDNGTSMSNISYKTEGPVGSRITKIEWKNVGFLGGPTDVNGVYTDFLNFQAWFYEENDMMEVRFGPKFIDDPMVCFDGFSGPPIALVDDYLCSQDSVLGNAYILKGNPLAPNFVPFSIDDNDVYLDGPVPEGMVYRFNNVPVGLQEVSPDDFSIYPNPASDKVMISTKSGKLQIDRVSVFSMDGKQVDEMSASPVMELDVMDWKPGIYLMKIQLDSGQTISKRFVKQ